MFVSLYLFLLLLGYFVLLHLPVKQVGDSSEKRDLGIIKSQSRNSPVYPDNWR